jgi:alkylated DNA repair dioxygenase AlkB
MLRKEEEEELAFLEGVDIVKAETEYMNKLQFPKELMVKPLLQVPLLRIKGLFMVEEFTSSEEERFLISSLDKQPWNTTLTRRTQHYGFIYDYKSKAASGRTNPIPDWCGFLINRLLENCILSAIPDQLIVNEYKPGQGIFPHVDDVRSFEDGIVSLSLGSEVMMDFVDNQDTSIKKEVALKRRSVISLHGDARYNWRHGIAARKSDYGIKRGRRVSLTFRKMIDSRKKPRVEEI